MAFDIINLIFVALLISNLQNFIKSETTDDDCTKIPSNYNIENGGYGQNPKVNHHQVWFYCNASYALVGNDWASCKHGKWESEPPKCIRNDEMPKIHDCFNNSANYNNCDNGYYRVSVRDSNFLYSSYYCNDNYTMVGKSWLKCENGKWSEPEPPKCLSDDELSKTYEVCFNNPLNYTNIENGRYEKEYDSLSAVGFHYSCNDNYTLIGESMIWCNNGTWAHNPPKCKPDEKVSKMEK